MAEISFWTAIDNTQCAQTFSLKLQKACEGYFYLGGRKAYVITGEERAASQGVILSPGYCSLSEKVLKIISYATVVIPLIALAFKAYTRWGCTYHFVDVKAKVEGGIEVGQPIIEEIKRLWPKIYARTSDDEVTSYSSNFYRIFRLANQPNLIFKMAGPRSCGARFEESVKAEEICLAHQLDLLVVPRAKCVDFEYQGQPWSMIAEEYLHAPTDEVTQQHLYRTLDGLDESVRQLAVFIIKNDYRDMEWRNVPIVDHRADHQGPRRLGLLDLERIAGGASVGIFGDSQCNGLIGCLFKEKQIDHALSEARHYGITSKDVKLKSLKAPRLAAAEQGRKLDAFYRSKGIDQNPRKLIQIDDLSSLGLDLEEPGLYYVRGVDDFEPVAITLGQAIQDVVTAINQGIASASEDKSLYAIRYVRLETDFARATANVDIALRLNAYKYRGANGKYAFALEDTWLARITSALVDKGYLFSHDLMSGTFVQA